MLPDAKLVFFLSADKARERKEAGVSEECQTEDAHSAYTDCSIHESLLTPQFKFQSQLELKCCSGTCASGPETVCDCSTEDDRGGHAATQVNCSASG